MSKGNYEDVKFFEKSLGRIIDRKHIVAVSSATEALRLALLSYGIGQGDEVLVTDFSWISSASCVSMVGAVPVFCDINLDDYHMDIQSAQRMMTSATRALILPHLFGSMADTSKIREFCRINDIIFIEDAAQAFGAKLNGLPAGTLGDCSCLSFNSNKVVAGINGGGALLTDDDELAHSVKLLRRHGKASDFSLLGYNSRMYSLNARVILLRLENLRRNRLARARVAQRYDESFIDLPVFFQSRPPRLEPNFHKYTLRFANKKIRDRVCDRLSASIHYEKPISKNSMFAHLPIKRDHCPRTEEVCDTILSLPIHPWLYDNEIEEVIDLVRSSLDL